MAQTFSCDIETDGIDATRIWCVAIQNVDTTESKVFYTADEFNAWLQDQTLIFHNGIAFDVPVLERLWGSDFMNITIEDTMILSQLDSPRREGGHSLANWGTTLGFPKGDHEDWSKLTDEMVTYCLRDVEITAKVYKILMQMKLSEDAKQLEYATKRHCSLQERTGWLFDEQGATQLLLKVNEDLRQSEEDVHKRFRPLPVWQSKKPVVQRFKKDNTRTKGYQAEVVLQCHTNDEGDYGYWSYPELNLGSRQQVGRHLMHYGWKPTEFTPHNKPRVDESILKDVDIPEAQIIARFLMLQKRQGQLNGWLDAIDKHTGRIHCRVHTIGTITHRMSSSSPNLQQVTASGKEYGSEMRALFTVPEDKVLVGADLSGLELRCLAHYMGDSNYTQEILTGDIHTANQKSAGLDTRDKAKTFIYAFLYGAGDAKIGSIAGGGAEEGRKLKENFLNNTPALKTLRTKAGNKALKNGYLNALDGRKIKTLSEHSSLNFLLQSAGAIIAKRAWVIFHELATHLNYKQLGVIHDEIQIECSSDDAEEIGKLTVKAMELTTDYYKLSCPISGEYKIGRSWNDTH